MKFKSILLQMVVNIGVTILAVCLGLSITSTEFASSALKESVSESMQKIAQQASQTVSERVNIYFRELEILSTDEKFHDLQANRESIVATLQKIKEDGGHLDMMVADKDGNTISADKISTNIADREYFIEAMKGNNCVSDPMLRKTDNTMIMVFAVPLKDANGSVSGMIGLVRSGHGLSELISDITYAKTGYGYVVNDEGTTIGHKDTSLVDSFDNDIENAKSDANLSQLAELTQKMITGRTGIGEYKYQGVLKYLAYCPIEGTDWSFALVAPQSEAFEDVNSLRVTMVAVSVAIILVGIAIGFFIARGFQKPIIKLVDVAKEFAQGNLDVAIDVDRKDELGMLANSLQTVSDNMNSLLTDIRSASDQVAAGAKQISDSSVALSQGASEQASSVEELTASVEEIASQTRLNAENAETADKLARETQSLAEQGNDKMRYMLKAMEDINVSSNNISKIIKVIDDIAFQTNILALNAAVEAARVGAAGKGFAVVADEVKNLAAKSANAAKETTDLIEGSIQKVGDGSKIANETAEELKRIVDGVSKAAGLIENIAVASKEQATGIEQINQGIMQVSQVVQANSATSDQSAAASEELSGQANVLKEQIAKFKLRDARRTKSAEDDVRINPEVLKTLDEMKQKKSEKSEKEAVAAPAAPKGKISLSDNEFGKY